MKRLFSAACLLCLIICVGGTCIAAPLNSPSISPAITPRKWLDGYYTDPFQKPVSSYSFASFEKMGSFYRDALAMALQDEYAFRKKEEAPPADGPELPERHVKIS